MSSLICEDPSTLITASASGGAELRRRGEKEVAMKRLHAGLVVALTLLIAQAASAQNPCGGVCQAYYPCDYPCDLCVGDPGLWDVDGGCWGEIVPGTCGDIGQCGAPPPCNPNWIYDQVQPQGYWPDLRYEPCGDWEWRQNPETGQWEYVEVCHYDEPYKCSIWEVYQIVRHQDNCPPSTSQTYCELGWQRYIGRYSGPWEWECCWDANVWNCTTYFPQCY